MEPRRLTSAHNPLAQLFRRVGRGGKGRQEGLFLLEGRHLLAEALASGWPIEHLLLSEEKWEGWDGPSPPSAKDVSVAPLELVRRLGTAPSSEGVLALASRRKPAMPEAAPGDLFLYLDGVQDPANVGILVRSALAFGIKGVFAGEGTADPFGPTALSRSAGAALHIPPVSCGKGAFIAWASKGGVRIHGADKGGAPPQAVLSGSPPLALALGNEGHGLSKEIAGACSAMVSIPMAHGFDSLNVAAAGSILLHGLAGHSKEAETVLY